MGYSFYEWSIDGINVSYNRVEYFMKIHNIKNIKIDYKEKDVINMVEYPNKGYVVKENNNCYVNLGK